MTTKEYLGQIGLYDRIIQNKLSEIYQLRTLASRITIAIKPDKIQTSGSKDVLGDTMSKVYDLEREVDALIDEYLDKKQIVVSQIEAFLKSGDKRYEEYYDVLNARFIRCLRFDDIPEEVNMSDRKVYYVYKEAMKEFEKVFGENYLEYEKFA